MKNPFAEVKYVDMKEKIYRWDLDFPIIVTRESPQVATTMHMHRFVELVCVYGGGGRHVLSDGVTELKKGDIFVIPRGMAHGYSCLPGAPLQLYNLLFIPERLPIPRLDIFQSPGFRRLFIPEADSGSGCPRFSVSDEELDSVTALLEEMIRENDLIRPASQTCRMALLMLLMCRLTRLYTDKAKLKSDFHHHAIIQVQEFLQKHFREENSIGNLARIAKMSPSGFIRNFRDITGLPPRQYILNLRLDFACSELVAGRSPVSEIAFNAGFNDSNYFTRLFHKHMGCTPRQYRARHGILQEIRS